MLRIINENLSITKDIFMQSSFVSTYNMLHMKYVTPNYNKSFIKTLNLVILIKCT